MSRDQAHLEALAELLDGWMRQFMRREAGPAARLYQMMGYHFGWLTDGLEPPRQARPSGKRLRALLCLLSSEAVGGHAELAAAPALAVELIHNFSLVHDDIQDRSEFRRHSRAVWAVWGMPQAINVGDGLFTLAQLALSEPAFPGAEPALRVQAALDLNQTCLQLVEGQYLDLALQEAGTASLSEYEAMVAGKTAALFGCACRLGALCGGGSPDAIEALADFGFQFGRAFQFKDDIEGVWGATQLTGKSQAEDVRDRKMGLPAVLVLESSPEEQRGRFFELFRKPEELQPDEIGQLVAMMERMRVPEAAARMAQQAGEHALAALARLRQAGNTGVLERLARALLKVS